MSRFSLPLNGRKCMPILEVGALWSHLKLRGVPGIFSLGDWCQAPVIPCTITPFEGAVVIPCDPHVVPVVWITLVLVMELAHLVQEMELVDAY